MGWFGLVVGYGAGLLAFYVVGLGLRFLQDLDARSPRPEVREQAALAKAA